MVATASSCTLCTDVSKRRPRLPVSFRVDKKIHVIDRVFIPSGVYTNGSKLSNTYSREGRLRNISLLCYPVFRVGEAGASPPHFS